MNKYVRYLISFIIGIVGGITSVYIGVGPSLMVPLVMFLGIINNLQTAVGTMFIQVISPTTIFPLYEFYKHDKLDIPVGICIAIGYLISTYIVTKYYLDYFNKDTLCFIYGIFSLFVSYVFIKKSNMLKKIF